MKRIAKYAGVGAAVAAACGLSYVAGLRAQQSIEGGVFQAAPGGTRLEVLFDGLAHDADVDVAELTFPAGTNSGDHRHGVTEIFYVLEGALEHVVNGRSTILEPGMLGHVQPPDQVNHVTDPDGGPTRVIVVWQPGGEAARLAGNWRRVE